MSNSLTITLQGTLIALVMFGTPAMASPAVDLSNPAFAPVTGPTSIPVGAADFCARDRAACTPHGRVIDVEQLTETGWQQLIAINDNVNRSIVPETDQDLYKKAEYWTYPEGRGDCEDIALEKQRELIKAGWDASTLLITVVRQANGEGHAVLMVRTDRGDLVLDNQEGRVLLWNDTPYQYIKRQSQADAGQWVGIADSRGGMVASR